MGIIDKLLAFLVPHECLGCGREGSLLCGACAGSLAASPQVPSATLRIRSATVYQGLARDLVWKLKSGGAQEAAETMARLMAALVPLGPDILIVPVPTASSRSRQRGYDQAVLLARSLSALTRLPCCNCLTRHGQSHQVGSSRQKRLRQLDGALRARKNVRGASLVLVDDVTTTGATLEAAALVLKNAGAKRVEAITFAYKPKET